MHAIAKTKTTSLGENMNHTYGVYFIYFINECKDIPVCPYIQYWINLYKQRDKKENIFWPKYIFITFICIEKITFLN